jgi:hypothetical protein
MNKIYRKNIYKNTILQENLKLDETLSAELGITDKYGDSK